jgi:hypothetical protein
MRNGTHVTRHGVPCDHTPSVHPDTLKWSPTTSKVEDNGHKYFRMHFGPYDAPWIQWVRADNISDNPRHNRGNFNVYATTNSCR